MHFEAPQSAPSAAKPNGRHPLACCTPLNAKSLQLKRTDCQEGEDGLPARQGACGALKELRLDVWVPLAVLHAVHLP